MRMLKMVFNPTCPFSKRNASVDSIPLEEKAHFRAALKFLREEKRMLYKDIEVVVSCKSISRSDICHWMNYGVTPVKPERRQAIIKAAESVGFQFHGRSN
jgi:hypothetical protein